MLPCSPLKIFLFEAAEQLPQEPSHKRPRAESIENAAQKKFKPLQEQVTIFLPLYLSMQATANSDEVHITHISLNDCQGQVDCRALYAKIAKKVTFVLQQRALEVTFTKGDGNAQINRHSWYKYSYHYLLLEMRIDKVALASRSNGDTLLIRRSAVYPSNICTMHADWYFLQGSAQPAYFLAHAPVKVATLKDRTCIYFYKRPDHHIAMQCLYLDGSQEELNVTDFELSDDYRQKLANLPFPAGSSVPYKEKVMHRIAMTARTVHYYGINELLHLNWELAALQDGYKNGQMDAKIWQQIALRLASQAAKYQKTVNPHIFECIKLGRQLTCKMESIALYTYLELESEKMIELFKGRCDRSASICGLPKEIILHLLASRFNYEKQLLKSICRQI